MSPDHHAANVIASPPTLITMPHTLIATLPTLIAMPYRTKGHVVSTTRLCCIITNRIRAALRPSPRAPRSRTGHMHSPGIASP